MQSHSPARWSALFVALVACGATVVPGCASTGPSEADAERIGAPKRPIHAPVPGEDFLRGSGRTILCREAEIEVPLHLESELFVVADRVARRKDNDRKLREGLGQARVKFAEGVEIREADRILVTFRDCARVRIVARGNVVFLDQEESSVVRNASSMRVDGNNIRFEGPYRVERLTPVP